MTAPPEAYWSREGERSGTADGYFIAGVFWCGAASKDSKEERLF